MDLELIFEQDLVRVENCALAVNKDRLLIACWLADGHTAFADEVGIIAERITGLDQLVMVKTLVGQRHNDPIDEALIAALEEELKVLHKVAK